ncbi:hypothetical protein [Embleya sp. NBC_00896]|uniref:hypothetical protein n=1 Tax=Embleya sp. NBC_00896 TaxID=2975961 RepID=UPI002F9098AD|nr:hypothetical protein OG928_47835 [Embleya sp. NBC_00896]
MLADTTIDAIQEQVDQVVEADGRVRQREGPLLLQGFAQQAQEERVAELRLHRGRGRWLQLVVPGVFLDRVVFDPLEAAVLDLRDAAFVGDDLGSVVRPVGEDDAQVLEPRDLGGQRVEFVLPDRPRPGLVERVAHHKHRTPGAAPGLVQKGQGIVTGEVRGQVQALAQLLENGSVAEEVRVDEHARTPVRQALGNVVQGDESLARAGCAGQQHAARDAQAFGRARDTVEQLRQERVQHAQGIDDGSGHRHLVPGLPVTPGGVVPRGPVRRGQRGDLGRLKACGLFPGCGKCRPQGRERVLVRVVPPSNQRVGQFKAALPYRVEAIGFRVLSERPHVDEPLQSGDVGVEPLAPLVVPAQGRQRVPGRRDSHAQLRHVAGSRRLQRLLQMVLPPPVGQNLDVEPVAGARTRGVDPLEARDQVRGPLHLKGDLHATFVGEFLPAGAPALFAEDLLVHRLLVLSFGGPWRVERNGDDVLHQRGVPIQCGLH